MYFYGIEKYSGFDKIFYTNKEIKAKTGDLIKIGDLYFLLLGDEISFPDFYKKQNFEITTQPEIVYKKFLTENTISIIHFIAYRYYSSYINIMPMFIDYDIIKILMLQTSVRKNNVNQKLIIFPDIWTISNYDFKKLKLESYTILHGQTSPKQKIQAFRGIKSGKIQNLVCTYSQLFQDWINLKDIMIFDIHKWYYKNQQDPRYSVLSVLEKISDIYGSNLEMSGYKI